MSAIWKAQKMELINIIERVSIAFGGDEDDWLAAYCVDVLLNNVDDLDACIDYFEDLFRECST